MQNVKKFRRIGVLTSGGDAPGMNAAVRAVTRSAIAHGVEVIGIYEGYKGLVDKETKLLGTHDVSNTINHGGTVLFSNRCLEFKTPEGMAKALDTCRENKIDGIVAIGGDGTFRGALDLTRHGIPTIGIPGTIDNDISSTEYAVGFDTAMNTVIEMVDRLRDTCESHARCNVVEVMGRDAGYIALECGIAVGAVGIAIKEMPFDEDRLIAKMNALKNNGKRNFIVMVAEGLGADFSEKLARTIDEKTKIETKFARLAHVQRGGAPTLRDRLVASQMGDKAVQLLLEGNSNLVVCLNSYRICAIDIEWALAFDKVVKGKMKDEDKAKWSAEQLADMEKQAEEKKERFRQLYELADTISG